MTAPLDMNVEEVNGYLMFDVVRSKALGVLASTEPLSDYLIIDDALLKIVYG